MGTQSNALINKLGILAQLSDEVRKAQREAESALMDLSKREAHHEQRHNAAMQQLQRGAIPR